MSMDANEDGLSRRGGEGAGRRCRAGTAGDVIEGSSRRSPWPPGRSAPFNGECGAARIRGCAVAVIHAFIVETERGQQSAGCAQAGRCFQVGIVVAATTVYIGFRCRVAAAAWRIVITGGCGDRRAKSFSTHCPSVAGGSVAAGEAFGVVDLGLCGTSYHAQRHKPSGEAWAHHLGIELFHVLERFACGGWCSGGECNFVQLSFCIGQSTFFADECKSTSFFMRCQVVPIPISWDTCPKPLLHAPTRLCSPSPIAFLCTPVGTPCSI